MKYIADLHIHSKYSRSCSKDLTPENIAKWCEIKGIDIVSTADFTHPAWFAELQKSLEPAEPGLYKLRDCHAVGTARNDKNNVRFLVSTELSCIYRRNDKCRRVHLCVWMPSLESAEKFTKQIEEKGGNVRSDGRPILGMDSEEILKMALEADSDAVVIPAHAWTPWFSVFGSFSGFDSLEECFGKNAKHIFAIETGLSSDPSMNWRLSALDNITLISNSDAHSLEKLGREANVFSFSSAPDYKKICRAVKTRKNFLHTIEFFPEEGKYHLDGHRDCGVRMMPEETKKNNFLCPKCKKPVTVGVLHRVDKLADRKMVNGNSFIPPLEKEAASPRAGGFVPYKSAIPLQEIVAECFGQGVKTKKVLETYWKLIKECGTEFDILLEVPIEKIKQCAGELVGTAIDRMRRGDIYIAPGYDGEFGIVKIFSPEERQAVLQKKLI